MKTLLLALLLLALPACFYDPSGLVQNPNMEQICDDGEDNDDDTFIDCDDQDCCGHDECKGSPTCAAEEQEG